MNSTAQGPQEPGHQLFRWLRSLEMYRSEDCWIGGVGAALADKLRWDRALVRGLAVVAVIIFTSPVILFYGVAWLLLPDEHGRIHAQDALRGNYAGGFWGASILSVIGVVNVFMPNVIGPFAIVLNVVIIALVAWLIWSLFNRHGHDDEASAADEAGRAEKAPPAAPSRAAADSAEAAAAETPPASGSQAAAIPADTKPAWYPKDRWTPSSAGDHGAAYTGEQGSTEPKQQHSQHPDSADTERRRRHRLISFGLVLLAAPLIAGSVFLADAVGIPTTSAALLGLAGVVVLLGVIQLWASLRGQRGHGGLLGVFTTLMMLVFLVVPSHQATTYVFGNYSTESTELRTAFSNTTVDLRYLEEIFEESSGDLSAEERGEGSVNPAPSEILVKLTNTFGNTTVILPDDVSWNLTPGNFLGNLDYHTQDFLASESGIGGFTQGAGPENPLGHIRLEVTNAFGNLVLYDETTYEQEELGRDAPEDELNPTTDRDPAGNRDPQYQNHPEQEEQRV